MEESTHCPPVEACRNLVETFVDVSARIAVSPGSAFPTKHLGNSHFRVQACIGQSHLAGCASGRLSAQNGGKLGALI